MRTNILLASGPVLGAALHLLACSTTTPVPETTYTAGRPDVSVSDGRRIYEQRCSSCHGVKGDGKGPNSSFLSSPPPRDFTRGLYEFRSTTSTKLPRRVDLVRTISVGISGTPMPAWGEILPPRDVESVAAYLETFSPRFAAEPESQRSTIVTPPEPPISNATELEAGRMLYMAFRCWECHGITGKADGPNNPLYDDWKRVISPANFTRGKYKSGPQRSDLYRTISTGLDGTPMPTFGLAVVVGREGLQDLGQHFAKLDAETQKDVTAFVAKLPTDDQLSAASDESRNKLGERRIWLLVGYVRSLAQPGLATCLFDDPYQ